MLDLNLQARNGNFLLKISCNIDLNEITAVYGPSGGGKTTLLRSIAGLATATGALAINGTYWLDSAKRINVAPRKRSIGYVSQRPVLFPHFSVQKNLAFVVKQSQRRRTNEVDVDEVVADSILNRCWIAPPAVCPEASLPRGNRSRLLTGPELLLLDEPLGSLDSIAKQI